MTTAATAVRAPLHIRFWSKVRVTRGCWLWTASTDGRGYGQFMSDWGPGWSKNTKAYRVAWELTHGPIPEGMHVLHKCDNPPCVRPDHLFLGTHQDNMADAVRKGRFASRDRHHWAKLSSKAVAQIRASNAPCKVLAAKFGVHKNHISRIRRGVIWRKQP